jgi:Ca2+-binding EF-hand superfamily protein
VLLQKATKPDITACQEYFTFLDAKSKGYLTKDDFRAYFQAEYHYPSDRDL